MHSHTGICAAALLVLCALTGHTQNLLTNPDLSKGMLAPEGWGFNTAASNRVTWQESGDGKLCSVLLEGSGSDWAGLTSHAVTVSPGEQLTVGAWVRILPGRPASEADHLYIRFFTAGRFIGQQGPSLEKLSDDWKVVSGVLTAPEGADRADVSMQIWSAAKVQISSACLLRGDQRSLVPSTLPPAPVEPQNWKQVEGARGIPADADDNGLADKLEAFLGISPETGAVSKRRTRTKTTSLQTGAGYRPDNDLKVDVVIVADNQEQKIHGWSAAGYEPHVMVGFRAGQGYIDGTNNGIAGKDEAQTDLAGRMLTCGPGSYYMVPTRNRRELFRQYFADAVRRGAKAACPEEPEFFSRAGYSAAFKAEWQDRYGEPWEDQVSSVQARFKSERLKVELERKLLQACYEGARGVDPDVPRFLLAHSPLSYTAWGITFGHHDMIASGMVDAMIAQVWTGTARSGVEYEGLTRERTFENAYLEYASCVGLVRDLDIDLWFLMDPLEDNPDRSMEDYHSNYLRTLAAALMFPEVTRYETMPWPTRIFGRVPDEFATEICSVINLLADMQNQDDIEFDCGTTGIGTFLSDSAMWQRGAPHASDMSCFYGIALPLLMKGIPVQVPHLDRAAEPGYLDSYRLLFVSYDMLKPMDRAINEALADWTRRGGCLVVLGGEDPYNDVPSWWQEAGFATPQDHLLSLCGFDTSSRKVLTGVREGQNWQTVAKTGYTGRELENQSVEKIDLTPFLRDGKALVKFEDSLKDDGWGPLIMGFTLEGIRNGVRVKLQIRPDTQAEQDLIALDGRSSVNPEGCRFCDRDTFVVYRFAFDPGSTASLSVQVGNQYQISAMPDPGGLVRTFDAQDGCDALGAPAFEMPASEVLVTYAGSGARPLYGDAEAALLSELKVGQGSVLFAGLTPAWFARSAKGAATLRSLTRYAIEGKLGETYREHEYLKLRRGRYTIARAFDAPLELPGEYVDVLRANLPLVSNVRLEPGGLTVLYDAQPDRGDAPKLMFAASCVEWQAQDADRLRMIVSGPRGTPGACRIYAAGREVAQVRARNVDGEAPLVEVTREQDTVLLRYPGEPSGLAIEVRWAD